MKNLLERLSSNQPLFDPAAWPRAVTGVACILILLWLTFALRWVWSLPHADARQQLSPTHVLLEIPSTVGVEAPGVDAPGVETYGANITAIKLASLTTSSKKPATPPLPHAHTLRSPDTEALALTPSNSVLVF